MKLIHSYILEKSPSGRLASQTALPSKKKRLPPEDPLTQQFIWHAGRSSSRRLHVAKLNSAICSILQKSPTRRLLQTQPFNRYNKKSSSGRLLYFCHIDHLSAVSQRKTNALLHISARKEKPSSGRSL